MVCYDYLLQTIAEAIGDWYFSRRETKEIDCEYLYDTTCHNLIPLPQVLPFGIWVFVIVCQGMEARVVAEVWSANIAGFIDDS